MNYQARFFCFTIFSENWSHEKCEEVNWLDYLVYQKEEASTTGGIHYQCFIRCSRPIRPSAVQKWCGHKCHIEAAKAYDKNKARLYCMKDDTRIDGPWEVGDWIKKKSNISKVRDDGAVFTSEGENEAVMAEIWKKIIEVPMDCRCVTKADTCSCWADDCKFDVDMS